MNPHSYRLKGRDFVHQGKIEIEVNERAVFIRTQGCFFVYTNSDCFLNSLLGSRRERKIGICGVVNMKKKILKAVLGILICWGIFVAIEGFRLIGSTDPGKCPLITLGSTQTADEIADYGSLGFSQTYHLTNGDAFVYGEFRVWGIRIARWES